MEAEGSRSEHDEGSPGGEHALGELQGSPSLLGSALKGFQAVASDQLWQVWLKDPVVVC